MFHVIGVFVVLLLRTNPHPEEVLRLLPLVNHLVEEQMRFCNNALSALYSRHKRTTQLQMVSPSRSRLAQNFSWRLVLWWWLGVGERCRQWLSYSVLCSDLAKLFFFLISCFLLLCSSCFSAPLHFLILRSAVTGCSSFLHHHD